MNESVQVRNAPGRWAPVYRSRAAEDLLSRIPNRAPRRIAEVFGGQGPMTALLARRFPGAEIEAFDLSRCDDNLAATLPDRFHTQVLGGRALNVKIKFEVVFRMARWRCCRGCGVCCRSLSQCSRGAVGLRFKFPTISTNRAVRSCEWLLPTDLGRRRFCPSLSHGHSTNRWRVSMLS